LINFYLGKRVVVIYWLGERLKVFEVEDIVIKKLLIYLISGRLKLDLVRGNGLGKL